MMMRSSVDITIEQLFVRCCHEVMRPFFYSEGGFSVFLCFLDWVYYTDLANQFSLRKINLGKFLNQPEVYTLYICVRSEED